MKTQKKEKKPASYPKKRGLNSDEQKRRTNRPVPEFPDGTDTEHEQNVERDTTKKERYQ
jgi:hypothetical protein